MTMINTESASRLASVPPEKPRARPEGTESADGIAAQSAAAGEAVPEAAVQSARYRMMREANALSAESTVSGAEMARELTASVRDMILGRSADSVRIQSGAIPREAFRLLD